MGCSSFEDDDDSSLFGIFGAFGVFDQRCHEFEAGCDAMIGGWGGSLSSLVHPHWGVKSLSMSARGFYAGEGWGRLGNKYVKCPAWTEYVLSVGMEEDTPSIVQEEVMAQRI